MARPLCVEARPGPSGQSSLNPAYVGRATSTAHRTCGLTFHLALRQAEGFARSVLRLLGLELSVPDLSTLSRQGREFAGRHPRAVASSGTNHLVLDSTAWNCSSRVSGTRSAQAGARRTWQEEAPSRRGCCHGRDRSPRAYREPRRRRAQVRALLGQAEGQIAGSDRRCDARTSVRPPR